MPSPVRSSSKRLVWIFFGVALLLARAEAAVLVPDHGRLRNACASLLQSIKLVDAEVVSFKKSGRNGLKIKARFEGMEKPEELGSVSYSTVSGKDGVTLKVHMVYVAPEFRKRGIYTLLRKILIQSIEKDQGPVTRLKIDELTMSNAIAFYSTLGNALKKRFKEEFTDLPKSPPLRVESGIETLLVERGGIPYSAEEAALSIEWTHYFQTNFLQLISDRPEETHDLIVEALEATPAFQSGLKLGFRGFCSTNAIWMNPMFGAVPSFVMCR